MEEHIEKRNIENIKRLNKEIADEKEIEKTMHQAKDDWLSHMEEMPVEDLVLEIWERMRWEEKREILKQFQELDK